MFSIGNRILGKFGNYVQIKKQSVSNNEGYLKRVSEKTKNNI